MVPRATPHIIGVAALAALLSIGVVLAVDWSEAAVHDPARTLLLGPREAFAAAQHPAWPAFGPGELALYLLAGAAFVVPGLWIWISGRYDLAGPLLAVAGLTWLAAGVRRSSDPLLFTSGALLTNFYLPVVIPVLLGFPSGRLHASWERWCVRGCWVLAVFGVAAEWMFFDPRQAPAPYPSTSVNLFLIRHDPVIADRIQLTVGSLAFLIGVVLVVVCIRRWHTGTVAYRAGFWPVMVGTTIAGVIVLWILATALRFPGSQQSWTLNLRYVPIVLLPMAIAYGQVRYRMARAAVSDAMVEIGATPIGAGFLEALRRALRDPTLALWRFDPVRGGYVDDDGVVRELPRDSRRVATVLEREGVPVAALIYDELLRTEPELLAAVRGATELALDHEQLRNDLQEQLAEVRRSRERIVTAGDRERRRIERDLHDGVQQRLVAAAIMLRRAQRAMADPNTHSDLLTRSASEVDTALAELRELARGVYPPVLAERGLPAAVTALAERSPIPVETDSALTTRPPPGVELAAYFIIAEAITNAAKHSGGTHVAVRLETRDETLRVVVADDGLGGAQVGRGGLSGLCDRAAALGGDLTIDSPHGGGTVLVATLPLRPKDTP
ncbi:sensor histidine kinase [Nocardia lijiangensis]|uniref:sensor histidine kinase n=1 Tax=Nocardia lijiangensis TaxID=299618 RepID=UPI003D755686